MAIFKKKGSETEGAKEWEQTLVAEEEPREGDSEFKFKFGKGEEEPTPPEAEEPADDEDFFGAFGDEPEMGDEEAPPMEPDAADPARELDPEAEDWDDAPVAPPTMEPARPIQHTPQDSPDVRVVQEAHWKPRRPETIAQIEKNVDNLVLKTRRRPKGIDRWLKDGLKPAEFSGGGMELIPPNIRSKQIVYETEGGFVVEVEFRQDGDLRTKYYTVSSKQGRRKALASIKSGAYAKVTTVTDEMIEALKPNSRRPTRARIQPGKVSTYGITNSVNVTDIEGIGDEYQGRLKEIGFYTTDQLRLGNAKILAAHVGVTEGTVRFWQEQAEVMLVDGIGPQLAELIVRAGIKSLDDLKKQTPKQLADAIKEIKKGRKVRITAAGVGPKRAQTIIRNARKMRKRSQPFPELGPPK